MNVVDNFGVKFWNGYYYCEVKYPDGFKTELKSKEDLTYTQWQGKIKEAWDSHTKPVPQPDECQCPDCKATFLCPNRSP